MDIIDKQLGFVPNLYRIMSVSPAVLTGFTGLQAALSRTLDAGTRHCIALAVTEINDCDYCTLAHLYAASELDRLSPGKVMTCSQERSSEPKRKAAVAFAKKVAEMRGKVTDADLAEVRDAGFTGPQIIEIVSLSAQFLLTNLIKNVAQTDIDFPTIEAVDIGRARPW